MYPGQSVVVNPNAAGTRVLLYPGNRYVRVLPPLREPGGNPLEPIHLHMPVHHRVARIHRAPKVAAADTTDTQSVTPDVAPAPVEAAPPPAPRHTRHPKAEIAADTTPAPDTSASDSTSDGSSAAIPFSFSGEHAHVTAGETRTRAEAGQGRVRRPPPAHTLAPVPAKTSGEPASPSAARSSSTTMQPIPRPRRMTD